MGGAFLVLFAVALVCSNAETVEAQAAPPMLPDVRMAEEGWSVRIEWDAVEGADHYRIFHSDFTEQFQGARSIPIDPAECGGSFRCRELASVRGTGYVHAPRLGGNAYWVQACNGSGCSPYRGLPDAVAFVGPPSFVTVASSSHESPAVRVVDRSEHALTISLRAARATHFELRRRRGDGAPQPVETEIVNYENDAGYTVRRRGGGIVVQPQVTVARYADPGLRPGTVYYYRARACNSFGCSEFTPQFGGMTEAADAGVVPAVPQGVGGGFIPISGTADDVEVRWNVVPGATYYEVYQDSVLDGTVSAPRTNYRDYSPDAGVFGASWSRYTIRACNRSGCSLPSEPADHP